ncbi:hypothetical protein EDC04DRAFT_2626513, partial [Pisolithus marmoratus]
MFERPSTMSLCMLWMERLSLPATTQLMGKPLDLSTILHDAGYALAFIMFRHQMATSFRRGRYLIVILADAKKRLRASANEPWV